MNRRKLIVTKGKLELASVYPDSPLLLIGRSPACDMVLRLSGLQPVHFLLEWAGEGEFNADKGIWVLTQIERAVKLDEMAAAQSSHAQGVVVGAKPVNLGGLTWAWSHDSLSRGELPTGTLQKQVQAAAQSVSRDLLGEACLEVIRLSTDGQTVVDVEHLVRGELRASKILPLEPGLKVRWRREMPSLDWGTSLTATAMNARAQPLPAAKKTLEASDLIFLEGPEASYYFRLVPRLAFKESRYEIFSDPFLKFAAICFVIAAVILYALHGIDSPPLPLDVEKKPRMATVEIKQAAQVPLPEPKVEIQPVEPPPPPRLKPAQQKQAKKSRAPKIKIKAAISNVLPPVIKPAPPAVNVNTVGLLGSMKKSNHANSGLVAADTIVSRSSHPAAGADGKVLVSQAAEIVDMQKSEKNHDNDKDVLAEAASKVSLKDNFVAGEVKAGTNRFKGAAFSIDAGETEGDEASSLESGFGESVHGGLSRGEVGHAVFAERRKIRACYQTALVINPRLSGRVVLKWQISASGSVTSIQLVSSDVNQPSLESCVMAVLRATKFPLNPKNEPTKVLYPFVFKKT